MARSVLLIFLLVACQSAPRAPELTPPRFAVLTPDGLVIHDGETRSTVPATDDLDTFCWTRDGLGFLGTTRTELVAVPPHGPRRVLSRDWFAIRFPALSPDGKRIAVGARRKRGEAWGVWLIPIDGKGKARRLVDGYGPSWSADGQSIYYERYKPNQGLSIMHLSNRETHPFLDDGRQSYTVSCARSGRMVAFTRGRALTLYEPGKSSVRELTSQRTYNRFPSFSPGERYLIFFRQDPTGETHPERAIVILDLETETEQIIDVPASLARFAP